MIVRAQIAVWMDSLFPRDAMVINPHFNAGQLLSGDWQDFANALVASMATYYSPQANKQVQVKIYDAEGTPPVFPEATAIANQGSAPPSGIPREVAVCLSYYSEQNVPSKRGRLYVPVTAIGQALENRPTGFTRTKILALGDILKNAGGSDVDWVLWSRKNTSAHPVTNFWVDDEYDTVRSRGLRPTMRETGTTSEL